MSDIKRGTVILITAGDAEITRPIADGIMAGRAARLSAEQIRTVEAEIDRQAIEASFDPAAVARRMRVAMHPEPVDYAGKIADARGQYETTRAVPPWLQKVLERALIIYAMFVEAVAAAYRAQGKVLEVNAWRKS